MNRPSFIAIPPETRGAIGSVYRRCPYAGSRRGGPDSVPAIALASGARACEESGGSQHAPGPASPRTVDGPPRALRDHAAGEPLGGRAEDGLGPSHPVLPAHLGVAA